MNSNIKIETHPIAPWLPEDAVMLMCGTFPPGLHRFSMHFYYPNFINDMWRIMGLILTGNKDEYVDTTRRTFREDAIKAMLTTLRIALSDTGREVRRLKDNASDKYLDILTPIDLTATLRSIPACRVIATTGEKAASVIAGLTATLPPSTGQYTVIPAGNINGVNTDIHHYRMPSSSRAYPLPLSAKAHAYASMLFAERLLPNTAFPDAKMPEIPLQKNRTTL